MTADSVPEPFAVAAALALLGLLPFAFMMLTSFVKISTVLQITRSAIGAHGVPSNMVVLVLAAALSLLAMAPVGARILDRVGPYLESTGQRDTQELVRGLFDGVREPLKSFLSANASEREKSRFLEVARRARAPDQQEELSSTDWAVVIPAFLVTELLEAFALGFAIFLPFVVIDLVVSNVLVALGMQTMSPAQVSLPFKLLLFVATDGWGLLAEALVSGYAVG